MEGEQVRALQGARTVGKKMELEENHISSCYADHWIRNLVINVGVLWVCCPVMPLLRGTGFSCSWKNQERLSRDLGLT